MTSATVDGPAAPGRAAVLGSPVRHSLSPVLHRAAYAALGLDGWTYAAIECDESGLPGRFAALEDDWRGLSLTMPLKRVVIPLLAEVSPLALAVGGVNTVTWRGPGRRPVGDNTDVTGLVRALGEAGLPPSARTGCVLGAGATAASALAALAEIGITAPDVLLRDRSRAGDLLAAADRLGVRPRLGDLSAPAGLAPALAADVVVCTLPASGGADVAALLAGSGPPAGLLLDVAYDPWPTPLARAWAAAGAPAAGGFGMLLHQAAEQVRLMTGAEPPLAAMRADGEAELARRAQRDRAT